MPQGVKDVNTFLVLEHVLIYCNREKKTSKLVFVNFINFQVLAVRTVLKESIKKTAVKTRHAFCWSIIVTGSFTRKRPGKPGNRQRVACGGPIAPAVAQ